MRIATIFCCLAGLLLSACSDELQGADESSTSQQGLAAGAVSTLDKQVTGAGSAEGVQPPGAEVIDDPIEIPGEEFAAGAEYVCNGCYEKSGYCWTPTRNGGDYSSNIGYTRCNKNNTPGRCAEGLFGCYCSIP